MFTTYIENCEDEIKVDIGYDYQPEEPMTWNYPGCPEAVEIYEVTLHGTDNEIFIIDADLMNSLEEKILEHIADEMAYQKYGYLLED
jgi:hypothetical protein